jgi:hypothetical protein
MAGDPGKAYDGPDECCCNPAFGTDDRCPLHRCAGEGEDRATAGPLESMVYAESVNGTQDDVLDAVAALAQVLDGIADEIEEHLDSVALAMIDAGLLRSILLRLRLEEA